MDYGIDGGGGGGVSFMGGNAFCLKACDPSKPNDARYCEHRFDRIGCEYNAPNNARNGTFESCDGDDQDFPGIYMSNGVVMTYTQPPEALGDITAMPYTAHVPASSNCVQYTSAAIYTALPRVAGSNDNPESSGSPTNRPTGSTSASAAGATTTTSGTCRQGVAGMEVSAVMAAVISSYLLLF
jgi:hypothetical protein